MHRQPVGLRAQGGRTVASSQNPSPSSQPSAPSSQPSFPSWQPQQPVTVIPRPIQMPVAFPSSYQQRESVTDPRLTASPTPHNHHVTALQPPAYALVLQYGYGGGVSQCSQPVSQPGSQSQSLVGTPDGTDGKSQGQGKNKKKKTGRKAGHQNYTDDDVHQLMDIIVSILPLGRNEWAAVTQRYNSYAIEKKRMTRDLESLKAKFDRLENTKKPTGDPSCPEPVRRANEISRHILEREASGNVGSSDDDDEKSVSEESGNGDSADETEGPVSAPLSGPVASAVPEALSVPTASYVPAASATMDFEVTTGAEDSELNNRTGNEEDTPSRNTHQRSSSGGASASSNSARGGTPSSSNPPTPIGKRVKRRSAKRKDDRMMMSVVYYMAKHLGSIARSVEGPDEEATSVRAEIDGLRSEINETKTAVLELKEIIVNKLMS